MSASQFDQRYDSIYQRGGGAPETARSGGRPSTPQMAASRPAAPTAGHARDARPAVSAAATELAGDSVAQSTGIGEIIPPDAAPQVRPEDAPAARRKINPYLVALWVLGLGLTVLGAWGSVAPYVVQMDSMGTQGPMPNGFPWFIMVSTLAPNVAFAGLVIIAGTLTLHALGWIRRHG
ncbi:hypothetical protein [Arthrobacter sp.]|uniref:hypothetical protein n=1 Tax=Arthrobacter sp. TaxID=1667 RepID=UPI003397F65B